MDPIVLLILRCECIKRIIWIPTPKNGPNHAWAGVLSTSSNMWRTVSMIWSLDLPKNRAATPIMGYCFGDAKFLNCFLIFHLRISVYKMNTTTMIKIDTSPWIIFWFWVSCTHVSYCLNPLHPKRICWSIMKWDLLTGARLNRN